MAKITTEELLKELTLPAFIRIESISFDKLMEDGLTDREFMLYNMIKFRLDGNWNPVDPLTEHGSLFHFWNIDEEDKVVDEYFLGFNDGGDLEDSKFQSNNSYYDCASPVLFLEEESNTEDMALKTFEISADVEILSNAMQYTDDIKPLLSKVETKEFKIESFEKAEEAVVLFIESQFEKSFNKNNVEASPDLSSSIVYHFSSGDFMFQLFIDVKHEGKKVVFPDYYPANVVTEFKLENTGDKRDAELITKACSSDNQDYICESCMSKVLSKSDLSFYLANYATETNIEIFQSFSKAKQESVNGKVYKATLNRANVWCEDGEWNYEDNINLFIDEPVEISEAEQ